MSINIESETPNEIRNRLAREKWHSDEEFRNRQNANRRLKYKNSDLQKEKLKQSRKELLQTPEGRIQCNLWSIKCRALKKGIDFSLCLEDLLPLPTHCPVLGVELNYGFKYKCGPDPFSPSIDRIDPNKGYVPENVILVSTKVNMIKQNASAKEIRAVADFYERYSDE